MDNTAKKEIRDRIIRIKLIDGTKIKGRVNINRNDGFDRLSDLVSSNQEPFLILIDAVSYEAGIENPVKYKTLFVNKTHILWSSPDETQE